MAITTNQFTNKPLNTPMGSEGAKEAILITPHATNYLEDPNDSTKGFCTRGISFGTAGTLEVELANGDTVIIPDGALAAGVIHPLQVVRVDSDSGASDIVGYR